eukprot:jgi/Picsp_1/6191/NSC_03545-R1_---NA---
MNRKKTEISAALKYCEEKLEGRVGRGKGIVKELDHQAQADKSDAQELSQLDSKVRILRNVSDKRNQEARQAVISAFNIRSEADFNRKCIEKKQREVSVVLERTERSTRELKRMEGKIQKENESIKKKQEKEIILSKQQMRLDRLALEKVSELKKVDREMKHCARESNELNVFLLDLVDKIETESARGQHLTRQLRMNHPDRIHATDLSILDRYRYPNLAGNEGQSHAIPCEQLVSELDGILCGCIQVALDARQDIQDSLKRTQNEIFKGKQEALTLDQSIHDMNEEIKILESQKRQCQRDFDILKSEYQARANVVEPYNSHSHKTDAKHIFNLQFEHEQLKKELDELNVTLDHAMKEHVRLLEEHSRNCSLIRQRRKNKHEELQKEKSSKSAPPQKSNTTQSRKKNTSRQIFQAKAHLRSIKRQIADTIGSI